MNKQITGLHNRLMDLIDKSYELFLQERPFLDGDAQPEIFHLEEVKQNQLEIELTSKAIQSAINKSLPIEEPPKQQELLY